MNEFNLYFNNYVSCLSEVYKLHMTPFDRWSFSSAFFSGCLQSWLDTFSLWQLLFCFIKSLKSRMAKMSKMSLTRTQKIPNRNRRQKCGNLLNSNHGRVVFLQFGMCQGPLKVGDTGFKVSKFNWYEKVEKLLLKIKWVCTMTTASDTR